MLLFAAALVMGVSACTPNQPEITPEISVDVTELVAPSAAEWTTTIEVAANTTWIATSDADWCFATPDTGNASATVTVTALENTTYEARTATITFTMQGTDPVSVTVTQPTAKANTIVEGLARTIGAEGGEIVVNLMSNVEYTVAVAEAAQEWLSVAEATRALEAKSFTIVVAANESYDERVGQVIVTSELGEDIITVTQSETGAVVVSTEPVEVASVGGEVSILVKSNRDYTVSIPEECTWITRPSTRALTETEEKFVVAANEDAASRAAVVTFTSEFGTDEVVIKQAGNEDAVIEIADARFKSFLVKRYDANSDKALTKGELNAITELVLWSTNADMYTVVYSGLTSLSGIEYMDNLEKLDIRNSATIEALDVTKNAKLTELLVQGTGITTLDLSGNPELKVLNVNDTKVAALNLSANTKLEKLYAGNTAISTLDLAANTALRVLNAGYSKIAAINLSKNTALEQVYLPGNKLTSLDVTALTALKAINVEANKLTSLDLSKNTELKAMNAGRNSLTSINVAGLANLKYLTISNNAALSSVSLSGLSNLVGLYAGWTGLTSLDIAANTNLAVLSVNNTKLTSLSTAANDAALRGLRIDGSKMTTYDVSGNKSLAYLFAEETSSLATIKVWDDFNVLVPVPTFYKDKTTEWEGGFFPDAATGINLCENGTANCYIVNAPGKYYFTANVKGNGYTGEIVSNRYDAAQYHTFVNGTADVAQTSVDLAPASAEVLWFQAWCPSEKVYVTTCPIKPESVMLFENGDVEFETEGEELIPGNVVIAAKDEEGNIIWSWHIWIANGYDAEASKVAMGVNNLVMMDRNIGANIGSEEGVSNGWIAGTAVGMTYQHGRKDPFPGPFDIKASCYDGNRGGAGYGAMTADGILMYGSNGTGGANQNGGYTMIANTEYQIGLVQHAGFSGDWTYADAVAYANANPHRLIHNNNSGGNSYPYDWWGKRSDIAKQQLFYYWGGPQVWPSCADVIKTIYDPCPAGWFVPGVDFSNCIANQSTVTAGNFGWNVALPSGQTSFFPKTGTRWGDATKLDDCNVLGAYWINAIGDNACGSMNFVNNSDQVFQGVANINNPQKVEGHHCLAMGISTRAIRCVRIEE